MGNHDWYRKVSWAQNEREAFFLRLKKCRSLYNKSQYLRIQAYSLQKLSNPPLYEAALELLDKLFKEAPHESQLASAYLQKAGCLQALGRIQEAVDAYREAARTSISKDGLHTTSAPLLFGAFAIKNRLTSSYDEVIRSFKGSDLLLVFPEMRYLFHSILAVAGKADGRIKEARAHAMQALDIGKQTAYSDDLIDAMLVELVMEKPIVKKLRKKLVDSGYGSIELNPETAREIYDILYYEWLGNHKPNIIMRAINPYWKESLLSKALRDAEQEISPPSSDVDFKKILESTHSEIIFVNSGLYNEPCKAVQKQHFLKNQNAFWSAGSDIGIFDETFSWVINVDDSGRTTISKKTK